MKYMTTWNFTPENQKAIIERFAQNDEPMDGIVRLGRWHVLGTKRGFVLIETDDPVALSRLNIYWSDLFDLQIVPVIDDEQLNKALSG